MWNFCIIFSRSSDITQYVAEKTSSGKIVLPIRAQGLLKYLYTVWEFWFKVAQVILKYK